MPRSPYIPTWFDDEQYLGLVVTFTSPTPSRWRLEQKINDREYHFPVTKVEVDDMKASTNLRSVSSSTEADFEPEPLTPVVETGECGAEEVAPPGENRVATSAINAEVGDTSYGVRPNMPASYGGEETGAAGDESGATGGTDATDCAAGVEWVEGDKGSCECRRACEACAVYICRRVDNQPKEALENIRGKVKEASKGSSSLPRMAIMKIRLQ